MKTNYIIIILLSFLTNLVSAQTLPIKTVSDSKKIIYSTALVEEEKSKIINQSSDLNNKIHKDIINKTIIGLDFLEGCLEEALEESVFESIITTNNILIFSYYTDETGKVYACSLTNYGYRINFSDDEIECVLSEAMLQSFDFEYKSTPFNFKVRVDKKFKIN